MKKILIILMLIIPAGVFFHLNSPPRGMQHEKFIVQHGRSLRAVAAELKKNNLIRDDNFFVLLSYLSGRNNIRAGTYEFFPDTGAVRVLAKLARGQVLTCRVTIPEGFNIFQIAKALSSAGITDEEEFLRYCGNRDFLASLSITSPSAEGCLFPDTYVFPEGSDPRDIITAMFRRMRHILEETGSPWAHSGTFRILILASLVEKEARLPEERVYVSSVFHNRLSRGMRLDCDPTVRYSVKKFTGRITRRDLESDSPYNTYRKKGLPPTPICSPGRASIAAALRPARSPYLYFVARNDGSHYFSKSLREHNRAVRYYQKGEKNGFTDTGNQLKP